MIFCAHIEPTAYIGRVSLVIIHFEILLRPADGACYIVGFFRLRGPSAHAGEFHHRLPVYQSNFQERFPLARLQKDVNQSSDSAAGRGNQLKVVICPYDSCSAFSMLDMVLIIPFYGYPFSSAKDKSLWFNGFIP